MTTEKERNRLEVFKSEAADGYEGAVLLINGHSVAPALAQLGYVRPAMFRRVQSQRLTPSIARIVHILDVDLAKEIGGYCFFDIGRSIGVLSLPFSAEWNDFISRVHIIRSSEGDSEIFALAFCMEIWAEEWANPFTASEYEDALRIVTEADADFDFTDDLYDLRLWPDYTKDDDRSGTFWMFAFSSTVRATNYNISEEVMFWSERLKDVCAAAARFILKERKNALVTFFEFPSGLKTACEQYLVYFIQFLEDLGIRADSEFIQQAGYVMFSVSPKDGASALANVKEALEIYLNLPVNHEFAAVASEFSDVAVTQLRANVFFLQSQLELAKAVIQAKDAAIKALDFTVFQQRQLLTASTEDAGSFPLRSQTNDAEPLIGNAVSVTTYEGKGFKVNLPHLLRQLKRALGVGA